MKHPVLTVFAATWLATASVAQVTDWTQITTATSPSGRGGSAMAYDSARGKVVMFGGDDGIAFPHGTLNDTWEYDGVNWTQVTTAIGPSARRNHAMVYDSARGKIVMFGGFSVPQVGACIYLANDTWEYDGSTWTQVMTATSPIAREYASMAYDSARGKVVMFGGEGCVIGMFNDTWEYDGVDWAQVTPFGSSPSVRGAPMAYDSARGKVVMFGGRNTSGNAANDVWEYDGFNWAQKPAGPSPRVGHRMVYDSGRGKVVMSGGSTSVVGSPVNDTWEYDGVSWTQMPTVNSHDGGAMAYDSARGKVVMFGGPLPLADTWEYGVGTTATFNNYGVGCPGSALTTCAQNNPTGGTLTGTLAPLEFGILASGVSPQVMSFDIFTQSTGGTQVIPAHIYAFNGVTPLASTTITVGPTPGFYTATFAAPVPVSGSIFLAIDVSSQTVVVPTLTSGNFGAAWSRTPTTGNWVYSISTNRPAWRVGCRLPPSLGNVGDPVLGTTYDITLSGALPSTAAIIMSGLSDAQFNNMPLPIQLPNAPGCDLLAAPDVALFVPTSAAGTATYSLTVPNSTIYIGLELFHQWAVLDAVNPLGFVVSDAGKAWLGT